MDAKLKPTKTEKILLLATVLFLCLITALCFQDRAHGTRDTYTVETERDVPPDRPAPQGLIDINTATEEQLEELPRIGEVLAGRIVAYREEHGPFSKTGEIQNVKGIGAGIYSEISDQITVEEGDR